VSPLAGAVVEGIATLLCRLASKALSEKSPKFTTLLDSFIGTSLVVAGKDHVSHGLMHFSHRLVTWTLIVLISVFYFEAFNYSGGYFNPVLSTSLKWGCSGHSEMEHVAVYWLGACGGALLSVPAFKHPIVRNLLLGEEKLKEE
jgi:aquaporin rerated protein, invertebrate